MDYNGNMQVVFVLVFFCTGQISIKLNLAKWIFNTEILQNRDGLIIV